MANFDALYSFTSRSWRPYAGGGPGMNFVDVTDGIGERDGLNVELVLNVIGGVEWGARKQGFGASRRYLLEARLGVGNTPDFKVTAGITF